MIAWIHFTDGINLIGTGPLLALYLIIFGGIFLLSVNALAEYAFKENIKSLIISKYIFNYCVLFLLAGSIILSFCI